MNLYVAICLLALTASAKADGALGLGGLGGLVYAPGHASADYYAYPRYAFEYSVKDPHTGDNKAQWEKRDGDVVKGAYSLVEPDGSLRVVEYWADDKSGFNAVVKRLGPNLHPPTVHAAPIYKAPIPILGHGPVVSPISIGPVANLGHLASAPLISGPVYGPALSTQNLIKDTVPILKPILPVPIHHEPILSVPIVKAPIVPASILHEPILKGPILPGPIYNSGPYRAGPILPGPIYKAGPIYPESSLGPLPIYKAPLPLYNKLPLIKGPLLPYAEIPLYKEPLPLYKDVPLYKEPLPLYKDLPLFKEQIPYYNREPIPLYKDQLPLIRGPLPALPLLKGPVELGPAEGWGLHGKGISPWVDNRPITSVDWESLGKGPIGRPYGNDGQYGRGFPNGHIGPVYNGPYEYLEKGLLNNPLGYRH